MFHYRTTNIKQAHVQSQKKKKKKKKKRKAYLPTLYFFNPLQETNIYFFLASYKFVIFFSYRYWCYMVHKEYYQFFFLFIISLKLKKIYKKKN